MVSSEICLMIKLIERSIKDFIVDIGPSINYFCKVTGECVSDKICVFPKF